MEAMTLPSWRPKSVASAASSRRRRLRGGGMVVRASGSKDQGGRLVDESMIVLRLRIREMKMIEMKNEQERACSNWMELEKKYYYGDYAEDVCEAVGLLQCYLMSVRPSFAVGMVVLVALSVLISSGVVFVHSLDMVNALFSSISLV